MKKALFALVAVGLAAQAPARTRWFGFAGVSMPQGEISDSNHLDGNTGVTLGIGAMTPLRGAVALGSRAELMLLKNDSDNFSTRAVSSIFQAEAQYYLDGVAGKEAYLMAGAGFHSTTRDTSTWRVSTNDSSFGFAYSFGVGYRGDFLLAEARYVGLSLPEWKYKNMVWDKAMTANGINLTFGFQF